jgi:hypothetical protein
VLIIRTALKEASRFYGVESTHKLLSKIHLYEGFSVDTALTLCVMNIVDSTDIGDCTILTIFARTAAFSNPWAFRSKIRMVAE